LERVVEKPIGAMTAPEQWGVFFRYLTDKSKREKINEIVEAEEGIAMASEVLMTISRDEVERARLMSEFKYQVDLRSHIVYAKQEAEQEKALGIARNFKAMGIPIEQIAQGTGLTEEQIRAL
jgi:predicted transposase/invertase (TIGR01784 family)